MSAATTPIQEPADDALIVFEEVTKDLGGQSILRGLSLRVQRGSNYVIMGPSGTGKSVTLKHIVGIFAPDRGRVLVSGREPGRLSRRRLSELRREIGYLFQDGALINWLNLFDNVALPLRETLRRPQAEVEMRVGEALERVQLQDAAQKMPSEISGGMRKRASLARAIVTRPSILLYDEPTAGLDPGMSQSIGELIREIQRDLGVTSVIVTHHRECALTAGDRVALFRDGKILVEGSARAMARSERTEVREFLGGDPVAELLRGEDS